MPENYDAVILGAGIAGLSCASALACKKKKVLVISRENLAGEATLASAGIMDPFLELRAGHPLLARTREAFHRYPSFIRNLENETGIKTDFERRGMFYTASNAYEESKMRDWFKWQRKTDIPCEWLKGADVKRLFPALSESVRAGLYYPTVSKINPVKLKQALWRSLRKNNVRHRGASSFPRFIIKSGKIQSVQAGSEKIFSQAVIIATGSWSGVPAWRSNRVPVIPVRGQVALVQFSSNGHEAILHTAHEGCYAVPWGKDRFLLGATVENAGFRPQVTKKGIRFIFDALKRVWPSIEKAKLLETRSGLRPRSKDSMPIVGEGSIRGIYYATGYYRSGVLLGPSTGQLLADGILAGKMPLELKPFSPLRFFK